MNDPAATRTSKIGAWLAPVLLVAFVFSPKILGPARLGDLILVAALPFLVPRILAWRRRPLRPWQRLYLAFAAWSALVTAWSLITGINQRGLAAALGVARLAEIGLLFLAADGLDDRARRRLRVVTLASLAALFGIAVGEALSSYILHGALFDRFLNSGIFAGEANHVAGAATILAAAVPAGLPLALGVTALTGSRTAFVAVLLLAARHLATMRDWRTGVLVGTVLAAMLLAPDLHRERFSSWLSPEAPPPARYTGPHVDRWTAWKVAVREAPIVTGVGLGARPSSVYESALVHLVAETGLPGLVFWLAALIALMRRSKEEESETTIGAPIALALLALGITANVAIIARIIGPAALLVAVDLSNQKSCKP